MRTHAVEGPAGRLVVGETGDGDELPVIFLHSDAGARDHWRHALAHVGPKRRALALDLRGHGASDLPRDGDFSYAGRAADVGAAA